MLLMGVVVQLGFISRRLLRIERTAASMPTVPTSRPIARSSQPGGGFVERVVDSALRVAQANAGSVMLTALPGRLPSPEAANFVGHLRASSLVSSLIAITPDDGSAAWLRAQGAPAAHTLPPMADAMATASSAETGRWQESNLTADGSRPAPLRDQRSRQLAALRWRLLAALARHSVSVWLVDVRVLWRQGPISALSALAELPTRCEIAFAPASAVPTSQLHRLHPVATEMTQSRAEFSEMRMRDASSGVSPRMPVSMGLAYLVGQGSSVLPWLEHVVAAAADGVRDLASPLPSLIAPSPRSAANSAGGGGQRHMTAQLAAELGRCAETRVGGAFDGARGMEAVSDGASQGSRHLSSSSPPCPNWCWLPTHSFVNGLRGFQQPESSDDATGSANAGIARTVAQHGDVAVRSGSSRLARQSLGNTAAVLADTLPPATYEYRTREAELWRQTRGDGQRDWPSLGAADAYDVSQRIERGERFLAYRELLINNGLSNARNVCCSGVGMPHVASDLLAWPPSKRELPRALRNTRACVQVSVACAFAVVIL